LRHVLSFLEAAVAVGVVDGLALLQQFDRAVDALGSVRGETKRREREDEKQPHWFSFGFESTGDSARTPHIMFFSCGPSRQKPR